MNPVSPEYTAALRAGFIANPARLTNAERELLFSQFHVGEFEAAIVEYLESGRRIESFDCGYEFDLANNWKFLYTDDPELAEFLTGRGLRDLYAFKRSGLPVYQMCSTVKPQNIKILLDNNFLTEEEKLTVAGLLRPIKKPTKEKIKKAGWVYLMSDSVTGKTKIGFSNSPKYREKTLQAEKPSIDLLIAWKGTINDEQHLHKMFEHCRVRGEWFDLTEADIKTIYSTFEGREVFTEK